MRLILRKLELSLKAADKLDGDPDAKLKGYIAHHYGLPDSRGIRGYRILKRSVDARRKPNLRLVYQLEVEIGDGVKIPRRERCEKAPPKPPNYLSNLKLAKKTPRRPLVVGTGPAGMFCAWLLARHGLNPVIVDRGFTVERRDADILKFLESRQVNPESNYLFGEGGAGTYSDGKLYTRVKDHRCKFVLRRLIKAGAPSRIMYLQRPHIGSDILPGVVANLRMEIEKMGCEFIWGKKVGGVIVGDGVCGGVVFADGDAMESPVTVFASGHSDRALILSLVAAGVEYRLKDFQIGCRIEHSQALVNMAQYAMNPPPPVLGAAEYHLVSRPPVESGIQGAASFCMCPGGSVMAAVCENGKLSTNGMSGSARDSMFANSAIITKVPGAEFADAAAAFKFLDDLEAKAFMLGGGGFACPAQGAYAFVRGETELPRPDVSYNFGVVPADLTGLLPPAATDAIRHGLLEFESKIPGFMTSGTLIGVETKISSPVRFIRREESTASSLAGLHIAGEAGGQAGGIVSAAVDGLKVAEEIIAG